MSVEDFLKDARGLEAQCAEDPPLRPRWNKMGTDDRSWHTCGGGRLGFPLLFKYQQKRHFEVLIRGN